MERNSDLHLEGTDLAFEQFLLRVVAGYYSNLDNGINAISSQGLMNLTA
jgi:hypothetical protein